VQKGQELLLIDPQPFQIAVDKAKADYLQALQDLESLRDEVEHTRATLTLAEADAQRAEKLFQTKVISTQELQVRFQDDPRSEPCCRTQFINTVSERRRGGSGGKHPPLVS
jgi:multidrug resistance efflux pump